MGAWQLRGGDRGKRKGDGKGAGMRKRGKGEGRKVGTVLPNAECLYVSFNV